MKVKRMIKSDVDTFKVGDIIKVKLTDGVKVQAILPLLEGDVKKLFKEPKKVDYGGKVPLYDYQEEAVAAMLINHYGILQSPAGSGKTQMGIALACALGVKTLWLTHTKDLLTQSKSRAEQYVDSELLGTITEGKVNIGKAMTFATIQTMCKLDLDQYRDEWDCVIVDECHRVSGTPTAVTQFSKVLNTLCARHKSLFASDRVRVIEFNRHFTDEEQDKGLKDYFETPEAMRGIFTWLVAGYFKYIRFGLKMSQGMQKVIKQYEKDNDLVLQFLEEKCERNAEGKTRAKSLYDNYKMWCKGNGYYVCSMKKFNAELTAHPEWYADKAVTQGVLFYYGVALRQN